MQRTGAGHTCLSRPLASLCWPQSMTSPPPLGLGFLLRRMRSCLVVRPGCRERRAGGARSTLSGQAWDWDSWELWEAVRGRAVMCSPRLACDRLIEAHQLLTLKHRDFGGRRSRQEGKPENLFKEMTLCVKMERITAGLRDQAVFTTLTYTLSFPLSPLSPVPFLKTSIFQKKFIVVNYT